jgi:F0F1-type ATP synthase membrane subunit b/b'
LLVNYNRSIIVLNKWTLVHTHTQEEEAAAAAAAVEAERKEAERVAELRKQYESAVPDEIKERVAEAVERELAHLKAKMEAQFQQQHNEILASLAAVEGRLPS